MADGAIPEIGTPAETIVSAPVHVEQNSNAPEAAGADHLATPGNTPAIGPDDPTYIEDQGQDDPTIEAPLSIADAAKIERARAGLGSVVDPDATYREVQSQVPEPPAGVEAQNTRISFAGKPRDFYEEFPDADGQPVPLATPEAPRTRLQRIGQAASKVISKFIPRK